MSTVPASIPSIKRWMSEDVHYDISKAARKAVIHVMKSLMRRFTNDALVYASENNVSGAVSALTSFKKIESLLNSFKPFSSDLEEIQVALKALDHDCPHLASAVVRAVRHHFSFVDGVTVGGKPLLHGVGQLGNGLDHGSVPVVEGSDKSTTAVRTRRGRRSSTPSRGAGK